MDIYEIDDTYTTDPNDLVLVFEMNVNNNCENSFSPNSEKNEFNGNGCYNNHENKSKLKDRSKSIESKLTNGSAFKFNQNRKYSYNQFNKIVNHLDNGNNSLNDQHKNNKINKLFSS